MTTEVPSCPLVSIITVAYNSESTIRDTLISVAQQDYPNIEHIIIDGASKDSTVDIARQFPHVRKIISEKDKGLYEAMNKGILASTGDVVGILNSDDFYVSPDVISRIVKKMQEDGSEAIYADLIYVDRERTDKIIRTWKAGMFNQNKFLFGWMPPHPTFFIKREWYRNWGIFNTQLTFSADYEIMIRFLYKHKIKVSYLPKIIVKMRLGGASNVSISNRLKANKEDRIAWKLNELKPYFFTVTLKPIRKLAQYLTRFSI